MDLSIWLILLAILFSIAIPFLVYRAFRGARALPATKEQVEGHGILPEEWAFVMEHHCLPGQCPRLTADRGEQPRDGECEVCAALFMERYWQRAAGTGGSRRQG